MGSRESPQGRARGVYYRLIKRRHWEPFPEGSVGFFYFRYNPDRHTAAGGLRFRIIAQDETLSIQQQFEQGHDLQTGPGRPWEIHLLTMHRYPRYRPILSLLLSQGLLSESADNTISNMVANDKSSLGAASRALLESPADPFVMSLSSNGCFISVTLHGDGIYSKRIYIRPLSRHCPSSGVSHKLRQLVNLLMRVHTSRSSARGN